MSVIYKEPNYTIVDKDTTTYPRIQRAGMHIITLFAYHALMTVIMYDVEKGPAEHEREVAESSKLHKQISGKLYYADDTIIMAKTAEAVEIILHRIENNHTNMR